MRAFIWQFFECYYNILYWVWRSNEWKQRKSEVWHFMSFHKPILWDPWWGNLFSSPPRAPTKDNGTKNTKKYIGNRNKWRIGLCSTDGWRCIKHSSRSHLSARSGRCGNDWIWFLNILFSFSTVPWVLNSIQKKKFRFKLLWVKLNVSPFQKK